MSDNSVKRYKENIRVGQGTLVIILINVVVFIVLNTIPGIGDKLLLSSDFYMIIKRPWTLVTVFFSHEIHLHLILNMVLLFVFGTELERIIHTRRLTAVYVFAGFIGSLAIVPFSTFMGTQELIAGASAAVFGIVTAFAVMRPNTSILKSKAKWWALALLIFNIITLILNPQTTVSAAAHIAGIMVGVVSGLLLKHRMNSIH